MKSKSKSIVLIAFTLLAFIFTFAPEPSYAMSRANPSSSKKITTRRYKAKKSSKKKYKYTKNSKKPARKPASATTTLVGFVNNVYDKNGKKYLKFDDVKFFTGNAAVEEAKKHGDAQIDENGKYYVFDSYYIVNPKSQFKTYSISPKATFNLCVYLLEPENTSINSSITKKTNYNKFKQSANDSRILCYITIKNNQIVNVTQQYIP